MFDGMFRTGRVSPSSPFIWRSARRHRFGSPPRCRTKPAMGTPVSRAGTISFGDSLSFHATSGVAAAMFQPDIFAAVDAARPRANQYRSRRNSAATPSKISPTFAQPVRLYTQAAATSASAVPKIVEVGNQPSPSRDYPIAAGLHATHSACVAGAFRSSQVSLRRLGALSCTCEEAAQPVAGRWRTVHRLDAL